MLHSYQNSLSATSPLQTTNKNQKNDIFDISYFQKKRHSYLKYLLAIIFVIIVTILIIKSVGKHTEINAESSNSLPSLNNDVQKVETTILSSESKMQNSLNSELDKYCNPTNGDISTDLTSIEFQYYFHPIQTNRASIIDDIKTAIPYSCNGEVDDNIIVVESHNSRIGGDIKSLRQRKNLDATKGKKIGLYDRTVKVLIYDINNFEERDDNGIASVIPKHSKDNVIEIKSKYEINKVIESCDTGIKVKDDLSYSETVEFDENQDFVEISNQENVNEYFDNVYSVFPSPFTTQITWLTWTKFVCDIGGNIGELDIDVQICYLSKNEALNGEGSLDPDCTNKINYRIDADAPAEFSDYEELQQIFSQTLPLVV